MLNYITGPAIKFSSYIRKCAAEIIQRTYKAWQSYKATTLALKFVSKKNGGRGGKQGIATHNSFNHLPQHSTRKQSSSRICTHGRQSVTAAINNLENTTATGDKKVTKFPRKEYEESAQSHSE